MKNLTFLMILSCVLGMKNIQKQREKTKEPEISEKKQQNVVEVDSQGFGSDFSLREDENPQTTGNLSSQMKRQGQSTEENITCFIKQKEGEKYYSQGYRENAEETRYGKKLLNQTPIRRQNAQAFQERYGPPNTLFLNPRDIYHPEQLDVYQQPLNQMCSYSQSFYQKQRGFQQSDLQKYANSYQPQPMHKFPQPVELFKGRCIGVIRDPFVFASSVEECLEHCFSSYSWSEGPPEAVSFASPEWTGHGYEAGCACQSDLKLVATTSITGLHAPKWYCAVNYNVYNLKSKRLGNWHGTTGVYFDKTVQKRKREGENFSENILN